MNLMADASSREDIWTKTMDFLNMPDWLKLEMVQSVGAKILHVAVWLVISWILLKLFCQVLRKITVLKMSPQASRLTVKIVKNAGYIIIGVEAFALMGFDILTLLGAASIIGVAVWPPIPLESRSNRAHFRRGPAPRARRPDRPPRSRPVRSAA